ncbi:MAG: GNAT family N-acetyltransferase [Pseudomonadota bacterium]
MKIRPPVSKDASAISTMVVDLNPIVEEPPGAMTPEKVLADAIGPDALLRCLVAEEDGALIGFAFWHDAYESAHSARGAHVTDFYVAESHRGAGVALKLMSAVAKAVKADGGVYIWLTAAQENARARAFYDKHFDVEEDGAVAYAVTREHFKALAEG